MSSSVADPVRQPRMFPVQPPRLARLAALVSLDELAREAGIARSRLSLVERAPDLSHPGELAKMRDALDRIVARRGA